MFCQLFLIMYDWNKLFIHSFIHKYQCRENQSLIIPLIVDVGSTNQHKSSYSVYVAASLCVCVCLCVFVCVCVSVSCLPLAVWRGSLWGSVWSRRKPRSGKDCHSNREKTKTKTHIHVISESTIHAKWNIKLNAQPWIFCLSWQIADI